VCYAEGSGVPKDYVQSYKWISLVANQGNETAKRNLTRLSAAMTSEQIEEGLKLAREFKPRGGQD
jgi:TPR repeat protein